MYPCEHLLFVVFLRTAILTGVRWYFIMFLILIPLVISNVEHLFMCLLKIYVLFGKISIQVFCLFFNWVVWVSFYIYLYELFTYFGVIGHIICNYFLLCCRLYFHFINGFLYCAKALGSVRSHLFIFAFVSFVWRDWPKKILLQLMWKSVLPVFSSTSL